MINRDALAKRRRLGLRQLKRWSYTEQWITPRAIGRAGITRCPCSCMGCGHQRKWWGPTLQEVKAALPDEEPRPDCQG